MLEAKIHTAEGLMRNLFTKIQVRDDDGTKKMATVEVGRSVPTLRIL